MDHRRSTSGTIVVAHLVAMRPHRPVRQPSAIDPERGRTVRADRPAIAAGHRFISTCSIWLRSALTRGSPTSGTNSMAILAGNTRSISSKLCPAATSRGGAASQRACDGQVVSMIASMVADKRPLGSSSPNKSGQWIRKEGVRVITLAGARPQPPPDGGAQSGRD